jgi:RimJ/RimL family protein N-acetyltransferase
MKIERTHDMQLVARIMGHPAIWPHIHEDGLESPAPMDHEALFWMLVSEDDAPAGMFLVHARSAICYEMHTMILPEYFGAKASMAAQMLLAWAFRELGCKKMVTSVPAYNRAAARFARANGMKEEGANRASFLRHGELIDQINMGITLKEWESCQQQQS